MNQYGASAPSFMSTPVQNALSPLAWTMATWMSSVSRTVCQAQVRSSAISLLKAL